jgi:hypothetical protein
MDRINQILIKDFGIYSTIQYILLILSKKNLIFRLVFQDKELSSQSGQDFDSSVFLFNPDYS